MLGFSLHANWYSCPKVAWRQRPQVNSRNLTPAGKVSVPSELIKTTSLAAFMPGFIDQGYVKSEQGQLTLTGKRLQPREIGDNYSLGFG